MGPGTSEVGMSGPHHEDATKYIKVHMLLADRPVRRHHSAPTHPDSFSHPTPLLLQLPPTCLRPQSLDIWTSRHLDVSITSTALCCRWSLRFFICCSARLSFSISLKQFSSVRPNGLLKPRANHQHSNQPPP